MLYKTSPVAIGIFVFFVLGVLALSLILGRRARSAQGYYAAHGQIHWFVNGFAFAGDYLSAASFLGICGLIAFYGYDGFLYSIGYLAGWIVALFVIAEPIKKLGKFTFADALDARFHSRGIKLAVALSTLVVSAFYLIPQMVGAGALVTPLLGLPEYVGVLIVGGVVTLIVVTAGMVSTTWVQFLKGGLLVIFCTILVGMILVRGLRSDASLAGRAGSSTVTALAAQPVPEGSVPLPLPSPWEGKPYAQFQTPDNQILTFRVVGQKLWPTQVLTTTPAGDTLVNGRPQTIEHDLRPVGTIAELPGGQSATGPLGPIAFLRAFQDSKVYVWAKDTITDQAGTHQIFYPTIKTGDELLTAGGYFKDLKAEKLTGKLNFISLMLALFCGTAALPHILIRYYTVKDPAAARKSTVVGIAAIGFFYVLTLYLGLGAMTSGYMDPTNNNMAAPLLAMSFSNTLFALISAIAFTTVLGTVSGLLMAGAGAVAHDLLESFLGMKMNDHQKVVYGKAAAVVLGVCSIVFGILFKDFNVGFLVGWAFNIAASANLPALVMLLFWRKTTAAGITAAVFVGMITSLGWILLSGDVYQTVYGWNAADSVIPFSQPALVTIPLGFVTLVVVSLLTQPGGAQPVLAVVEEPTAV